MIKNQKGFTLIEMMIVLLVISVLLVITVPNVTKNNSSINEKGCEAFVNMVQGQVQAYELDDNKDASFSRCTQRWRIHHTRRNVRQVKQLQ